MANPFREAEKKAKEYKNLYLSSNDSKYKTYANRIISQLISIEKLIESSKQVINSCTSKKEEAEINYDLLVGELETKHAEIIAMTMNPELSFNLSTIDIADLTVEFKEKMAQRNIQTQVSNIINKTENVIIGALRYTSKTLGTQTTVAKSALSADFPVGEQRDSWGFEPNYLSPSDSDIQTRRSSSTVNVGTGLITTTIEGDRPLVRDKKAAYWLVGILNEMVDAILADPPAKVYEAFLADGLLSADNLIAMSAIKKMLI